MILASRPQSIQLGVILSPWGNKSWVGTCGNERDMSGPSLSRCLAASTRKGSVKEHPREAHTRPGGVPRNPPTNINMGDKFELVESQAY